MFWGVIDTASTSRVCQVSGQALHTQHSWSTLQRRRRRHLQAALPRLNLWGCSSTPESMHTLLFLTLCLFLFLLLTLKSFLEGLPEDRNLRTDPGYRHSPCPSFIEAVPLAEVWSQPAPTGTEGRTLWLLFPCYSARTQHNA